MLLSLIITTTVPAQDWSCYGKDNKRASTTSLTFSENLAKVWNTSFNHGVMNPIIVDNKLYALATYTEEKTICLDAETGSTIWTHPKGMSLPNRFSSPCADENYIFVPTFNNGLVCLDAKGLENGDTEKIWNETFEYIPKSPILEGDRVYFSSGYSVYCYDSNPLDDQVDEGEYDYQIEMTQDKIWEKDYGVGNVPSPVTLDSSMGVVVFTADDQLFCLDSESGDKLWSTSIDGIYSVYHPSVTILGDKLFVITNTYAYCYAFDREEYRIVWQKPVNGNIVYPITLGSNKAFISSYDSTSDQGYITCRNAGTGELLWSNTKGGKTASSYTSGKVFSVDINNMLYCLNANSGETITSYQGQYIESQPIMTSINDKSYVYLADSYPGETGITCLVSNNPPADPAIIAGPIEGNVDVNYLFTAHTTDTEGHEIYYQFDWGDGTSSSWQSSPQASHAWQSAGDYSVKVRAKDIYNLISGWSTAKTIRILNDTPDQSRLSISAPSSVVEGENFEIIITVNTDPIQGATVFFNDISHSTDETGSTIFTAPETSISTSFTIAASKSGYTSATAQIIVTPQTTEQQGYIFGTVSNQMGESLSGAQVCVLVESTSIEQTSTCELTKQYDNAIYYVHTLQSGTYTLTASKSGYQSVTQQNVIVNENEAIEVNFVLNTDNLKPYNEQRQLLQTAIEEAKQNKKIGSEINLDGISQHVVKYRDLSIDIEKFDNEKISLTVSDENDEPTLLVITLNQNVLKDVTSLELLYDNEPMTSGSAEQLFSFTSDQPLYGLYIYEDEQGNPIAQLLIYIPTFSVHSIDILSVAQQVIDYVGIGIYALIAGGVLAIFFAPMIVNIVRRRRDFHRFKGR